MQLIFGARRVLVVVCVELILWFDRLAPVYKAAFVHIYIVCVAVAAQYCSVVTPLSAWGTEQRNTGERVYGFRQPQFLLRSCRCGRIGK